VIHAAASAQTGTAVRQQHWDAASSVPAQTRQAGNRRSVNITLILSELIAQGHGALGCITADHGSKPAAAAEPVTSDNTSVLAGLHKQDFSNHTNSACMPTTYNMHSCQQAAAFHYI
jgi:hypothetical protein